ncbi:uncharacterized protein LOC112521812 [Cynara cardunculus var. scolymus]|uniref:uncharacterized protein LOC112521812 n=1 Tax=Cynara cardunculus var. scolymus TaxID=59895 RepID=UPI000D62B545|nr:uncharacterized protein LOC112521812 [Cynara cardunculus var. scolymus]
MATDDPTARRRRIIEKGSDRLALITGRAPNIPSPPSPTSAAQSHHSYTSSCPSAITHLPDQVVPSDENRDPSFKSESAGIKSQPVLRKSESTKRPASKPNEKRSSPKKSPKSELKTYLYKTVGPNQLRPAILASQNTRRKCSFIAGIITLLSYVGFPILGSYIIKNVILSRPLFLLLFINVTIMVGPLVLDAAKMIEQGANGGSSTAEADFPDHLGSPFEWGMLFKTSLSAFFMDSCIYSVVVVCGISFLKKFGL